MTSARQQHVATRQQHINNTCDLGNRQGVNDISNTIAARQQHVATRQQHINNTCDDRQQTRSQLIQQHFSNTLATHQQHFSNTLATHQQLISNSLATHQQLISNTLATLQQHFSNTSATHCTMRPYMRTVGIYVYIHPRRFFTFFFCVAPPAFLHAFVRQVCRQGKSLACCLRVANVLFMCCDWFMCCDCRRYTGWASRWRCVRMCDQSLDRQVYIGQN